MDVEEFRQTLLPAEIRTGEACMMRPGLHSLAVCICTMDRPEFLRSCLQSIAAGSAQPDEIVVSDDGCEPSMISEICGSFDNVTYIRGPRRGLSANRNQAVRAACSVYVSLIDDDALLSDDFIMKAHRLINVLASNIILSGDVAESGEIIKPSNPTFWGHFGKEPASILQNINLNCNVFPRKAFDHVVFDEQIDYGYEDMDLCASLISKGFEIRYVPELMNRHVPPLRERDAQRSMVRAAEWARFYTTAKRHLIWHCCYLCLIAYAFLAPCHRAAHGIKSGHWDELPRGFKDMASALSCALREKTRLRRHADQVAVFRSAERV